MLRHKNVVMEINENQIQILKPRAGRKSEPARNYAIWLATSPACYKSARSPPHSNLAHPRSAVSCQQYARHLLMPSGMVSSLQSALSKYIITYLSNLMR